MTGRIVMIAAALMAFFDVGCIKPSQQRRAIVSFPEKWTAKEQRNCVLAADDPISKLPRLDCDLQSSDTPRSRMYIMDVKFSTTPERQLYVEWVCQRTNDSLVCTN